VARKRADGEGTIRKRTFTRKDGSKYHRYFAVISDGYKPDGKRKRKEGSLREYERDARLDLKRMIQERDEQRPGSDMTLAAYLAQWLEQQAVRPKSLKNYGIAIGHANDTLGHIPLNKLKISDMQAWIHVLEQRYKPSTIQAYKAVISAALNDAVRLEYIPSNPLSLAKAPKVPQSYKEKISLQQASAFLAYLKKSSDWMYPVFCTFLSVGLRLGELRGLVWDDYDQRENILSIRRQGGFGDEVFAPLKSEASRRNLYLNDTMKEALAEQRSWIAYKRKRNPDWNPLNLIFCTLKGAMFTEGGLRNALKTRQQYVDVGDFTIHDQRHFVLSHLVSQGYSAAEVSRIAGHSNPHITYRVYVRAFEERQKRIRLGIPTSIPTKNAVASDSTQEAIEDKARI
jgi:integrase